jgi:hypothetical protein
VIDQLINSLAILKVNWDHNLDYIQNFIPFVVECIRLNSHSEISLIEIQESLKMNFGIVMPQGVLKTILKRAARQNFIIKKDNIFIKNEKELEKINLNKIRLDVERKHKALVYKFGKYCFSHNIDLSDQKAEELLYSYLQNQSAPILKSFFNGIKITSSKYDKKYHEKYLTNSFILHLFKKDPEGFDYLETIVKGSMLASALFYPDISNVTQNLKN